MDTTAFPAPRRRGRAFSVGGREASIETRYKLSPTEGGPEAVGEGTWGWLPDLCPVPAASHSWGGGGCGELETTQV